MKKIVLLATYALLLGSAATAQNTERKPLPCEDCRTFPFKPRGCDHSVCLEQYLSVATREDLVTYFGLPGSLATRITEFRNGGFQRLSQYRDALEKAEYAMLINAYNRYVEQRTPFTAPPPAPKKYVDVTTPILFDVNSTFIAHNYYEVMDEALEQLRHHPRARVTIYGGTDNTGTSKQNMALSQKRAAAVAAYLQQHGVDKKRISLVALGDGHPFADPFIPSNAAKNRYAYMEVKN